MKTIRLQDFRCFSNQEIPFKSGVNLLVGDNASGKTSVLRACKYVLNAFFSGFSDENTKWINFSPSDFRQVIVDDVLAPEKPINIFFNVDDVMVYDDLLTQLSETDTLSLFSSKLADGFCDFELVKKSKKNSRALTSGIKLYKDYASLLSTSFFDEHGQSKVLPLFANFSTEDIHSNRKLNSSKFKMYHHKASFGYFDCLEGDGFLPYWIIRLLVLQEGQKNLQEISIVRKAIKSALGEDGCNIIDDMYVRPLQKKVYYHFIDGREVESINLSDGYRRLVNIVTDLSFRCALLNRGIYGDDSCERTIGTVLIDEIDLHLHPSLQALVLKGFRNTFPNLQFIVSSHAPMVMSGVESNDENVVYKLDYTLENSYSVTPVVTYGMDLSTISQVVLDQEPRSLSVAKELKHLFDLIDQENNDQAKSLLEEMKERLGNVFPDLVEAEAMLNCILPLSDEENN